LLRAKQSFVVMVAVVGGVVQFARISIASVKETRDVVSLETSRY
jgi:hypothetical protein